MTLSVQNLSGASDRSLQAASDAHGIMVELDARLTAVGLTRATFTGSYDPAGSSSQMPSTAGVSAWMAYNFTDSVQSSYPVTVWFSMQYRNFVDGLVLTYAPQFRISEGVDGSGNPLGRVHEFVHTGLTYTSNAGYRYAVTGSVGTFVRYSGDALTLLMCVNGLRAPSVLPYTYSLLELHIERSYSATTGTVEAGFAALAQGLPVPATTAIYSAAGWPATGAGLASSYIATAFSDIYATSPLQVTFANAQRAGGSFLKMENTTPIVMPVYYHDSSGNANTFKKMFTIQAASVTNCSPVTLDFSGAEVKYLPYWTANKLMYNTDNMAFLFEWE